MKIRSVPLAVTPQKLSDYSTVSDSLHALVFEWMRKIETSRSLGSKASLSTTNLQSKTAEIRRQLSEIKDFRFEQLDKTRFAVKHLLQSDELSAEDIAEADYRAGKLLYEFCLVGQLYRSYNEQSLLPETLVAKFMEVYYTFEEIGPETYSVLGPNADRIQNLGSEARSKFDVYSENERTNDIGIYTALEHEFQSVVRRLDRVHIITSRDGPGHEILRRIADTHDAKEAATEKSTYGIGVAIGKIGSKTVLVVCGGKMLNGDNDVLDGILNISQVMSELKKFRLRARRWCIVGVCGASNEQLPLGTTLISNAVHKVKYKASKTFKYKKSYPQMPFFSAERSFQTELKYQFRCDKALREVAEKEGFELADPKRVQVKRSAFACVDHVIKTNADRKAIYKALHDQGHLNNYEHFGIEMEHNGVADHTKLPTIVIKSVCDYADERKAEWSDEMKNLIQLYAADVAGDIAVDLIRSMQ